MSNNVGTLAASARCVEKLENVSVPDTSLALIPQRRPHGGALRRDPRRPPPVHRALLLLRRCLPLLVQAEEGPAPRRGAGPHRRVPHVDDAPRPPPLVRARRHGAAVQVAQALARGDVGAALAQRDLVDNNNK